MLSFPTRMYSIHEQNGMTLFLKIQSSFLLNVRAEKAAVYLTGSFLIDWYTNIFSIPLTDIVVHYGFYVAQASDVGEMAGVALLACCPCKRHTVMYASVRCPIHAHRIQGI